jgi:hypothetical protein
VPVHVGSAALKITRRKVEETDQMVDNAPEAAVGNQRGELPVDRERVEPLEVLERGDRHCRQPQLRPRQRRCGEESERPLAEDLVADRLVEEIARGQARRRPSRW